MQASHTSFFSSTLSWSRARRTKQHWFFLFLLRGWKNISRVKSAMLVKKAGGKKVILPPSSVGCNWPNALCSWILRTRLTNNVSYCRILFNIHVLSVHGSALGLYRPMKYLHTLCPASTYMGFAGIKSAQLHWFCVNLNELFICCSLTANQRLETSIHNPPSDCSAPAK